MIKKSSINFEKFMKKCISIQSERSLTANELKNCFLLKNNKSFGYDDNILLLYLNFYVYI